MRRLGHTIAIVMLVCLGCRASFGQGLENDLPNPMSLIRLKLLLIDALPLDDERWMEVERLHASSLERYRAEIRSEFIEKQAGFQLGQDDRTHRELRRFRSALASLEAGLFDEIGALVDAERAEELLAARSRRTAERLAITTSMRRSRLPASEAIRMIVREPDRLAPLLPELRRAERSLASIVERVADRMDASIDAQLRAVRDAKLPPLDPNDPAALAARQALIAEAAAAGQAQIAELEAQARELNSSLIRRARPLLSPSELRELRWRTADPYAGTARDTAWLDVLFQLARRSPTLDKEQRESARVAFEAWVGEQERSTDALEAIDRSTPEGEAAFVRTLQEINESDRAALRAFLNSPEPWVVAVRDRWIDIVNGVSPDELAPFDPSALAVAQGERYDPTASFVPPPIGDERIEWLATRLQLDGAGRAVLATLVADAQERWTTASGRWRADVSKAANDAQRIVDQRVSVVRDRIPEIVTARMRVFEEAAALDDALFASIEASFGGGLEAAATRGLRIARLGRTLERLAVGEWGMYLPYHFVQRPVDVVRVANALQLGADDRVMIETRLLASADALVAAATLRARAQAGLGYRSQSLMDAMFAPPAPAAAADDAGDAAAAELAFQQSADRDVADRLEGDRVVRKLFAEAIADLGEATRLLALDAYERAAQPDFFRDDRTPDALLAMARALEGIGAEAAAAIEDLIAVDRAARVRIAQSLGMERAAPPGPHVAAGFDRARNAAYELHLFDRDERSARTVAALRRLLTAEQRAAVSGLDDYERRVQFPRQVFLRFGG